MHDNSRELASAILRFRRGRARELPADLFGEPAWELLLELFIADAEGRRLTGRDILSRAGTTEIVLSRWLRYLSAAALIVGDGTGNLDDELTLSGSGMQKVESILKDAGAINQATVDKAIDRGGRP